MTKKKEKEINPDCFMCKAWHIDRVAKRGGTLEVDDKQLITGTCQRRIPTLLIAYDLDEDTGKTVRNFVSAFPATVEHGDGCCDIVWKKKYEEERKKYEDQ